MYTYQNIYYKDTRHIHTYTYAGAYPCFISFMNFITYTHTFAH